MAKIGIVTFMNAFSAFSREFRMLSSLVNTAVEAGFSFASLGYLLCTMHVRDIPGQANNCIMNISRLQVAFLVQWPFRQFPPRIGYFRTNPFISGNAFRIECLVSVLLVS